MNDYKPEHGTDVVATLRDARRVIADPQRWTQKAMARTVDGGATTALSPTATCWCLMGAVDTAADNAGRSDWRAYDDAMVALFGASVEVTGDRSVGPMRFNDSHTHGEVLALIDRAIEREESRRA